MKEYIDSLRDKQHPFSGNPDLLPDELYCKYAVAEAKEIEYLTHRNSGMTHPADLAAIKAEAITAKEIYKHALLERLSLEIQETISAETKETMSPETKKTISAETQERMAFEQGELRPDNLKEPAEPIEQQQFNIAVVDYLTKDVTIRANSEREAYRLLNKQYTHADIVLRTEDFDHMEVGQLETLEFSPGDVKLMATPKDQYVFTVQEIIRHVEPIEAESVEEALEIMNERISRGEILVGSVDDYMETHYILHGRIINNDLSEPVEIPLADSQTFQSRLTRLFPDGITVNLQQESVAHLNRLGAETQVNGLIETPVQELLAGHGQLKAEARLVPEDYSLVFPYPQTYQEPRLTAAYDQTVAAATLFLQQHPTFRGGRVDVRLQPQIMERIYIEDKPLKEVLHTIQSKHIQTDEDFFRFRNINKYQERISNISLLQNSAGASLLRCKIDGQQQSARRLSPQVSAGLLSGQFSKLELAIRLFDKELNRERELHRSWDMHR